MKQNKVYMVLAVVGIGAIAAYFFLNNRQYEVRFSEEELQHRLSERLPITKKYLLIFEVQLDNPRLSLINGSDRVNAGLDITLNIQIGSQPLPLGGTIDLSSGVRYESTTGSFYLTDPVSEQLAIQGIPERYTEQTTKILNRAIAEFYAKRPIYTLKDDEVTGAAAKMILKDVIVQDRELVLTIGL